MDGGSQRRDARPAEHAADLPWWPSERGRGSDRAPLTQREIVAAAIRLVDRDGLDALSMRRLGRELGAGATSIYWHVRDKDELLDLILDAVIGEVSFEGDDASRPWRERVANAARELRSVLVRHRHVASLFGARVTLGPNALAGVDRFVGIFRTAGFEGREVVLAYNAVLNYTAGFAVLQAREMSGMMTEGRSLEEIQRQTADMLGSLPPPLYSNIVAMVPAMLEVSDDDQFEFGLARLLDGLELTGSSRRARAG